MTGEETGLLPIRDVARIAARILFPRDRYQRGHVRKTGKFIKKWRLHWYTYEMRPAKEGNKKGIPVGQLHEERIHHTKSIVAGNKTKADAQKILDEIIAGATADAPLESSAMTFARFYRDIFEPLQYHWSATTKRNNEGIYRRFLGPTLGGVRLSDIRKHHVDALFASREGRGASELQQILSLLRNSLSYAAENSYIERNPVGRVRVSRIAKQGGETRVLTIDEARKVCQIKGEHGMAFRILLNCGLRIGELLALRWDDIQGDVIRIDETATLRREIKAPKGNKARTLPLTAALAAELDGYRLNREKPPDVHDFIFTASAGMPLAYTTAVLRFEMPARIDSGIPDLDFHCCRRTCATLLEDGGFAKTADIQSMLGHSNLATTRGHYIKPVEASQRKAVEGLYAALVAHRKGSPDECAETA